MRRIFFLCVSVTVMTACGARSSRPAVSPSPNPPASLPSYTGIASWYGPGFHGRQTANGEIYDQNAMTAAHKTLPLGTRIRVTNIENGRTVDVRINDRGPYVGDRILDLSRAAAERLDYIRQGTTRVRIDVIESPKPIDPSGAIVYTLQLGSFGARDNADRLHARVATTFPEAVVVSVLVGGTRLYRVQLGSFIDRTSAGADAERVKRAGFDAFVVEK